MPHELDHRHLKEIVNWLLNLGIVHSLKPSFLRHAAGVVQKAPVFKESASPRRICIQNPENLVIACSSG
jgi:hypothetical protein